MKATPCWKWCLQNMRLQWGQRERAAHRKPQPLSVAARYTCIPITCVFCRSCLRRRAARCSSCASALSTLLIPNPSARPDAAAAKGSSLMQTKPTTRAALSAVSQHDLGLGGLGILYDGGVATHSPANRLTHSSTSLHNLSLSLSCVTPLCDCCLRHEVPPDF